ncbi:MAG: 23S rRNA (adenine(2503)-C(2))-methyltransferase RlmN [Bryobacteraceae bacterium]
MTRANLPATLAGLDLAEIGHLLEGQPAYRARQVYHALYRGRIGGWDALTTFPKTLRDELASRYPWGLPEVDAQYSSNDGTRRYLLQLADSRTVEAVFMPEESRDTLCISSQVGCPVDCKFCLTALMGLERNLTAGEIAGQVLLLARLHSLDAAARQVNVVMMGQGEPLLNLGHVLKATRLLVEGAGLSERRITVSTSGIIPKMAELGAAPIRPKLAISLNASTEEQRRALMPITKKYHLSDLLDACRAYPLRPWERLTFEYVLLRDVNDSDADARRVAGMVGQLRAKVNLIAWNPGPGIPYARPDDSRVAAFQAIVRRSVPCFVRRPRGLDIYAACGQLQRMEVEGAGLVGIAGSAG